MASYFLFFLGLGLERGTGLSMFCRRLSRLARASLSVFKLLTSHSSLEFTKVRFSTLSSNSLVWCRAFFNSFSFELFWIMISTSEGSIWCLVFICFLRVTSFLYTTPHLSHLNSSDASNGQISQAGLFSQIWIKLHNISSRQFYSFVLH